MKNIFLIFYLLISTNFILADSIINISIADIEKLYLDKNPLAKLALFNGLSLDEMKINSNIVTLAYEHDYEAPKGFYKKQFKTQTLYLEGIFENYIFLSTDKSKARKYVKSSSLKYSNIDYEVNDELETDKFFDFSIKGSGVRIHKSSWVNWKESISYARFWDTNSPYNGLFVGYLNKKFLNYISVKELGEYSWFILAMHYTSCCDKVVRSVVYESPDEFIHLLYITKVVFEKGEFDTVILFVSSFIVKKKSGEILMSFNIEKKIKGKLYVDEMPHINVD